MEKNYDDYVPPRDLSGDQQVVLLDLLFQEHPQVLLNSLERFYQQGLRTMLQDECNGWRFDTTDNESILTLKRFLQMLADSLDGPLFPGVG